MRMLSVFVLLGAVAIAQDVSGDRITMPFSNASGPRNLKGSLMNGCFVVEGYEGNEVIVESKRIASRARRVPRGAEGMRRLEPAGLGLTVEEENNTVTIHGPSSEGEVTVRVPRTISMKMTCMNGGDLRVSNVTGDLELTNQNGGVAATNVGGSVLAHSLNGKVAVSLDRLTGDKPMSFSSLNGDVDVTLPPDARATIRVKSDNGEVFTDFDVQLTPNAAKPVTQDDRGKGGSHRVKADRVVVGTINGGGPDLTFKTLNGNVYLRKKK